MTIYLSLPLSFVIQASSQSSFIPKKQLSKILVSDAYLFDPNINRLRRRTCLELATGRNSILHLFRSLDSGDALIAAFLARTLLPGAPVLESADFYLGRVDLQLFYLRLNVNNTPLHLSSTKGYRLVRQYSAITPATNDIDYPSLSPSKWVFFFGTLAFCLSLDQYGGEHCMENYLVVQLLITFYLLGLTVPFVHLVTWKMIRFLIFYSRVKRNGLSGNKYLKIVLLKLQFSKLFSLPPCPHEIYRIHLCPPFKSFLVHW